MGLSDLQNTLKRILIDKDELRNNIREICQAAGHLRTAGDIYKQTGDIDGSRMAGDAAVAFTERLGGLGRSMANQAEACERVARYMETVLNEFERAENDVKAQINLFMQGRR